jgi:hypothetical protein
MNNGKLESKFFLIDHILLQQDVDKALNNLWSKYFTYLESLEVITNKLTIFAHNLGDFTAISYIKA